MSFQNEKKGFLSKIDKSRKKSVDEDIKKLVDLINSKEDYYSTSSCSGRIVLIRQAKKNKAKWLFVSHREVNFKQIKDALKHIPKGLIWLKQEDIILHITCNSIEDAKKLLGLIRKLGFKRTGIISLDRKITIEIKGNEYMDVPIAKDGKILVMDDYLKLLIKEANSKLKKAKNKIKVLENKIKILS